MTKDIRFAWRTLRKRPGFTAVVILVLSLGIGSTTAIFSIVDALLLRSLPYPRADRMVQLREVNTKGNQVNFAGANFYDLAAQNRTLEHLAVSSGSYPLVVTGGSEPTRARISFGSSGFFAAMGVPPLLGRSFLPEEDEFGGPVAAIVSYGYWQNFLDGRSDLDGMKLNVDGVSCSVVGVMPASFDYPAQTDVWITTNTEPRNPSRTAHNFPVIGLLREGVTLDQAQADVTLIAKNLRETHGTKTDAVDFALIPLQTFLTRNVRQGLWLLLGAVGLLLLVACANFSNLLLSQIMSRQREFTLRVALGASRFRLTRQILTENLLLALPGALLGALLAAFAVRMLLLLDDESLPRINAIGVDARVLAFSCALGVLIAVALSFLPGLRARRDLNLGLKPGTPGTVGGKGGRLRGALVVGQIGLTLVLLTGAGLLIRSFMKVMEKQPGFETGGAVAMTLSLPSTVSPEEDERLRQFYVQLLERVGQLPGVSAVGGINVLPLKDRGANGQFLINDDKSTPGYGEYRVASAGYFPAMKIPLLRGRLFDASDKANGQHVAVISQSLAQRYWPTADPIGQRIQFGNMDTDKHLMQIVGIVGDVRDATLEREPQPTVYGYSLQRPQWWQVSRLSIVVRSAGDSRALIPSLRATVQGLRSDVPMSFDTLDEVVASSFSARRFSLTLFAVFGGVALLITVIGLYGMLSYFVTERTREMGIRMALGARRANVLGLVMKQGGRLALLGIVAGLVGAWGLTRLMSSLLFDVTPTDSVTLVSVVLTLAMVALLACYVPARRATKVDPLVALREE
ncbi:MAG TPA: ABC transporter permease [Pyrinomonadaceae bacterium]|jgi:predicted permease|nr:ABC transporter permease [Pyrinomonadaceae bacterium]